MNTNWQKIKDNKPPLDILVLVFRKGKKKYSILKLAKDVNDPNSTELFWLTQANTSQDVSDEDMWMEFPHITETVTYA